jgi:N-acyl-D-aspartate/D-glutamate deacylase
MADLVIRNGTIIDGTGAAPFEADIAVENGKIVAMGKIYASGVEEIDARGKIVTPGFIDPHSHYDAQATWSSRITPSSWHGVTTTMIGNCGVGFAPCRPDQRDMLVKLMEGVEDIPEPVLTEGLPWKRAATIWTSPPRFRTPRCASSSWASAASIASPQRKRTLMRWRAWPWKGSRRALWVSQPRAQSITRPRRAT